MLAWSMFGLSIQRVQNALEIGFDDHGLQDSNGVCVDLIHLLDAKINPFAVLHKADFIILFARRIPKLTLYRSASPWPATYAESIESSTTRHAESIAANA